MSYKTIQSKASKACKIFMYKNKIVKMHTEKEKLELSLNSAKQVKKQKSF